MKKMAQGIIIFWLVILTILISSYELPFINAREVLLKTVPVDPRDLLRGDYVNLRYEISTLKDLKSDKFKPDSTVYVILEVDENNVATVDYISNKKPRNAFFIKGKVVNLWTKRANYGIESYFVKEGTGLALEKKLADGGYAKVKIAKNGRAKILDLFYK